MQCEITGIKEARKRLGLTQSELAMKAGVSQSMIAKVESGRIDPTYSNAKKVFDALAEAEHGKSLKAKDVMNARIISLKISDSLHEALGKMRKYGISQLPVIGKDVKGVVSEGSILEQLSIGRKLDELTVKDVMAGTPPILPEDTDIASVSALLKNHPIILISRHGKIVGVVTKADVIGHLYK